MKAQSCVTRGRERAGALSRVRRRWLSAGALVSIAWIGVLAAPTAGAVDVEVSGIVLEATVGAPAVLRTDVTLPADPVFIWPYVLNASGDVPVIAVSFEGAPLEQIDGGLIGDGVLTPLVLKIDGLQGLSGELVVSLTATDAGADSLMLVQSVNSAGPPPPPPAAVPLGFPVAAMVAVACTAVATRALRRTA